MNDKLLSFILTQLTSYMYDIGYRVAILYIIVGFFVLSSILIFFVKGKKK